MIRRLKKILHPAIEPEYINGYRVRRGMVTCPVCSVPPEQWCDSYCTALDLMDYR